MGREVVIIKSSSRGVVQLVIASVLDLEGGPKFTEGTKS